MQLYKNQNQQYFISGFDVNLAHQLKFMIDINSRFCILNEQSLYDTLSGNPMHISPKEMLYMKTIYNRDFKISPHHEIDFLRWNRTSKIDVLITDNPVYVEGTKVDGILGFSREIQFKNSYSKQIGEYHAQQNSISQDISNKSKFKSFFDDLYENFGVRKKIFSIYLNPESSDHFSYLILGEFEATIFKRRTLINFFSTRDYAWSFFIEHLQVGNTVIQFPTKQDTFLSLIHNYIGISQKTFKLLKEILSQKFNIVGAYTNSDGYIEFQMSIEHNSFQQNQIIQVHLSKSVYFDLTQRVYIRQCLLQVKENIVTCLTKIKILEEEGLEDVIILGTPFLQYYYSVYNQENNQVTIGLANYSDLEVAQAKFWYYIFVLLIFLFAILLISIGIFYKEEFQNLVLVIKNTIRYICCRDQQSRLELLNIANS